jgi:hypothetical protein
VVPYPDGQSFEIEGGGCIMAVVHYDDGSWTAEPESKANATLIAAAPDLFEALDELVSFLRAHVPHFQTYNPLTEDADKALSKARGEQQA